MRLGDESALEALYVRYGGLVYTLARRIVGDPELAREVVQDTFLRSWDGRDTYDPERGRVPWWLMGIARNRAIDLLRSRTHQARLRERERLKTGLPDSAHTDTSNAVGLRRDVTSALDPAADGPCSGDRGVRVARLERRAPAGARSIHPRSAGRRSRAPPRPARDPHWRRGTRCERSPARRRG